MRLGELLGSLDEERVDELCSHLVPGGEEVPRHLRAHSLESLLRDSGFIEQKLFAHQPPVLAILRELLEAREHRAPREALRAACLEATEHWAQRVATGALAARDPIFRVYRRILVAAWDNDLKLDASEQTLLVLLRKELGMSVIEHYLIAHHPDVQPYWRSDECFDRELTALLDQAIVFQMSDEILVPEEFVPRVQRALGLYLSRGAAIRLLEQMSNEDLGTSLEAYGVKKSGDKGERIDRIIEDLVPIPDVLRAASNAELREIARKAGAPHAGDKEELIQRLIEHFESGLDLRAQESGETQELVTIEPKELHEPLFRRLFGPLTNHQLYELLGRYDLKTSGTKELRLTTLWDSPYAERTLLKSLRNSVLSELCREHSLDTGGSKDAMIDRLISHHLLQHLA